MTYRIFISGVRREFEKERKATLIWSAPISDSCRCRITGKSLACLIAYNFLGNLREFFSALPRVMHECVHEAQTANR